MITDKPQIINRNITNFEPLPEKSDGSFRVISYNITADFFDGKDQTKEKIHTWKARSVFCKELILKTSPDIFCLQELSPNQAVELSKYFYQYGYKAKFLSQTPSDIGAGIIADENEVKSWIGKNVGTALIGTFYSNEWSLANSGCFWLNEKPYEVPTSKDRGAVDKGFGNMNTYRAVFYTKLTLKECDKTVYVFNSHYPLDGGNSAREQCAKLEMDKIHEISKGHSWISAGDRNLIPDGKEGSIDKAYAELIKCGHDIRDSNNHYGISTSWVGFSYDKFKNELKTESGVTDFTDKGVLDLMISSLKSKLSFHLHGAFSSDDELLSPTQQLTLDYNNDDQRLFASDHSLIGADFEISES